MTIDIAFSLLVTVPRDFIPKRFLYPPEAVLFASVVWFYRIEKKKKKKKKIKLKKKARGGGGGLFFQRQYQTKPNQIKPKPVQRLRERTSEQVTLDLNMTSPYVSFWVTFESFEQDQGSNFLD